MTQEQKQQLREARNVAMREAESAAYKYCCACETGEEREKAFKIYENLHDAGRLYK